MGFWNFMIKKVALHIHHNFSMKLMMMMTRFYNNNNIIKKRKKKFEML